MEHVMIQKVFHGRIWTQKVFQQSQMSITYGISHTVTHTQNYTYHPLHKQKEYAYIYLNVYSHLSLGSMTTMWNTTEWNLIQFHLHIPSEHTINGMHNDVEIHFVHANACGELLVMGVMLTITNTSSVGLELILGSMENPSLIPVGYVLQLSLYLVTNV